MIIEERGRNPEEDKLDEFCEEDLDEIEVE
jgi:hypothetical protein